MNPIPRLVRELEQARARVERKTFAQAPEAFKDIESVKARIRDAKRSYRREKEHGQPQERRRA